MRFIPSPKHQKLVNNCYPTGRTPDKKPKSSETAYLIYYVNSRRSKLEKVSNYLTKKSLTDLRKKNVGNISVTLVLLNEIIKNCKENLNVFVKDFMLIMNKILADGSFNNDLSVIDLVQECFKSICINVTDTLYSGDVSFVEIFNQFVELYFKATKMLLKNNELALKGCLNISLTSGLASNPKLKYLIPECVTTVLENLCETYQQFNIINLDASEDHHLTKRLSRTHTKTFSLGNSDDGNIFIIDVLKSYFNTNETDKLTLSIKALLAHLQKTPNKDLLIFVFDGIPVQLRYIVILFLVRQLTSSSKEVKYDIVLRLLSALLTSYVGIVGLSILDIMRKLLAFQLSNIKNKVFVDQCRITISDLNAKLYYNEQTSDMLYELINRLKSGLKDEENHVIIDDLKQITHESAPASIGLDIFLDLILYLKTDQIELFKLVDSHIPPSNLITSLFRLIGQLDDVKKQSSLMKSTFENYKQFALLSGLNYYVEFENQPSIAYYLYHENAAHFLGLSDYERQTEYKKNNKVIFTKDDLKNFYSDSGSNKFSKRGLQILMSHDNSSSVDLLSQSNFSNSKLDIANTSMASDADTSNLQVPSSPLLLNHALINTRNFSSDSKSLSSSRPRAPKISDLKKAYLHTSGNGGVDRSSTIIGTESLKSRVTNITFLLSELKSSTKETNKIQDPDEEETIGMGKIDIARSSSMRINPVADLSSGIDLFPNNRESIIQNIVPEDDEFKDAAEEFNVEGNRGKLFTA
ncbi:hypothetical protein TPHA_0G01410 [Tetrapisispora phaffii CBS 4417]|uniref:Protein EFR3 n=1 Tax=Tetrapisispora phaffii (strain ATCC 24235 / CBS 4417 / NBRC 1672 / NRRL Y-8282 / UCD 70-5) TaxID=1071381 RepID=G8BVQ0_TETPH|nr:hypothetical protein TPHA_0G01410 [Tetrapisispora phaffii CBS 4417]CCE63978.1 hypothetical protein TPHA_0G01410 [Tetrapisispora phaffii CBS 4417]